MRKTITTLRCSINSCHQLFVVLVGVLAHIILVVIVVGPTQCNQALSDSTKVATLWQAPAASGCLVTQLVLL